MIVTAISDLHGDFPKIDSCDLLLIAGDICPDDYAGIQRNWIRDVFIPWCKEQPAQRVIWIGGNHDFGAEMPGAQRAFEEISPPWVTYLKDETIEFMGNTIWGCPWTPNLQNWAFYASDRAWQYIADDIPQNDILVLHAPPRGAMLDDGHPQWASPYMFEAITQRVKPKLVVCGHIHEGFGTFEFNGITFANVALKDNYYDMVREPVTFVLDKENYEHSNAQQAEISSDSRKE